MFIYENSIIASQFAVALWKLKLAMEFLLLMMFIDNVNINVKIKKNIISPNIPLKM